MHILLVDSLPESQRRWHERLAGFEIPILIAQNNTTALEAIKKSRFTLVFYCLPLTDRERTSDNGVAALLKARCEMTVCVVQDGSNEHRTAAYEAGFDECIFHNCSDLELASKIEQVVNRAQLSKVLANAQKLESIGELTSGIAHEINTPIQYVGDNTRFVQTACDDLISVLASCQELVDCIENQGDLSTATDRFRAVLDEADFEYLVEEVPLAIGQSLEGIDRVTNIVRAMKRFAHPGPSEMTLTDLSSAIETTIMVARNEWKYFADIETEFDPDLPLVPCLPGELNQVLLNMIVNASHSIADKLPSEPGSHPETKGKITISTASSACHAEIRISDTGAGIAEEHLQEIFKPFFTTKSVGKGTGQGLAIAHSVVVEKHGGTLQVESEQGIGTTFVIRLPLTANQAEDAVEELQPVVAPLSVQQTGTPST